MNIFQYDGSHIVNQVFNELSCSACSSTAIPNLTALCGVTKTAGKTSLFIFYSCDLAKTNDWANTDDIIADLATDDAIAFEVEDEGLPAWASERASFATQDIIVSSSLTVTGRSINRQSDNSDLATLAVLSDLANNGKLRVAHITKRNDLRDLYYGNVQFADSARSGWEQNTFEENRLDFIVTTDTPGKIFTPATVIATGAIATGDPYTEIRAVAF